MNTLNPVLNPVVAQVTRRITARSATDDPEIAKVRVSVFEDGAKVGPHRDPSPLQHLQVFGVVQCVGTFPPDVGQRTLGGADEIGHGDLARRPVLEGVRDAETGSLRFARSPL